MSQAKVNDCTQKTETPSDKPKADDNGDAKKIVSAILSFLLQQFFQQPTQTVSPLHPHVTVSSHLFYPFDRVLLVGLPCE